MVSMKTDTCPTCGGIVFKLAGKASKLCFNECLDCRTKRAAATQQKPSPAQSEA